MHIHVTIINENRSQGFDRDQEGIYGRTCREEIEGGWGIIISNIKIIFKNNYVMFYMQFEMWVFSV